MSAVARPGDFEDDEREPSSGTHRTASIAVLESMHDLSSTLLDLCDEPTPLSRPLAVRLVARRFMG